MYKDIELKTKYYTELIIKQYIKQGIYPNNSIIKERLNDIELRSSIFRALDADIEKGMPVNVEELNSALNAIYNDLIILYKTLEYVTMKKYKEISSYIDAHLKELNEQAEAYASKASLETYATTIGKTISYQYKEFQSKIENGICTVPLENVKLSSGTKIAVLADINNADYKNIIFKFTDINDSSNTFNINAYNYNHDMLTVPGDLVREKHEISINEQQKINGILELPMSIISQEDGEWSSDLSTSDLVTLGGKNKILYKKANEDGEIVEENPVAINSLKFSGHNYIDFYIVDGSTISFRFNKKPIATNFNIKAGQIKLDYIHHFFIECDDGFSFDFEIDKGDVYAYKEKTIINNSNIYYSGAADIHDFLIIKSKPQEEKTYSVSLVSSDSIAPEDINGIAIKNLGIY